MTQNPVIFDTKWAASSPWYQPMGLHLNQSQPIVMPYFACAEARMGQNWSGCPGKWPKNCGIWCVAMLLAFDKNLKCLFSAILTIILSQILNSINMSFISFQFKSLAPSLRSRDHKKLHMHIRQGTIYLSFYLKRRSPECLLWK